MLDYKNSRLDYGKQISPPPGYVLDRAVTTTYSLEMMALLSVPVALIYSKNLDDRENWMNLFDSIRKASEKLKVYCQKSKIIDPKKPNILFALVEDIITEILPPSSGISFHPKIWVLRFTGPQNSILYRFIVLSRNLTFARDWDIAFSTEGFVSKTVRLKNKPLTDYVSYLAQKSDFEDSKRFIIDLNKVDFQIDWPFEDFQFHPIGFGKYLNPLSEEKFHDLIIISPFLDAVTLKHFSQPDIVKGNRYLFSRKEELDKIHLDILGSFTNVYSFSGRIVDGEEDVETLEEDEVPLQQNLHAKIFIGNRPDGRTSWFLGSANCSGPAIKRNEEFLIRLNSNDSLASVTSALTSLVSKADDLMIFDKYERETREPVETDEYDFREDIHSFLTYLSDPKNLKIECPPNPLEAGHFDLSVEFLNEFILANPDLRISFAPFGRTEVLKYMDFGNPVSFTDIALHHLSKFFAWKVEHVKRDEMKEFVLKMEFVIPDGRQEAIYKNIFEDKDKFFQFLRFLLGNINDGTDQNVISKNTGKNKGDQEGIWNYDTPIFEELLFAASREPERLKEIETLINKIKASGSGDIIPEEFLKIWNAFHELI